MMKFSRSYDRSVLIYREEGPQGRILLRLGRTFEDGECRPDDEKSIPETFHLLTYIIAKDPEALVADIAEKFGEYLDDASEMAFHSIMFDTLKLQERIRAEQANPEGSELLRSLDIIYGRQVIEILFAATFGQDGRKTGKSAKLKNKHAHDRDLPIAKIGILGFICLVVVPIAGVAIFQPDFYQRMEDRLFGTSKIIAYASKHAAETLASAQIDPAALERQRILEEARLRKQDFYLNTDFGSLTEDQEYKRTLHSALPSSSQGPITQSTPEQNPTSALGAPLDRIEKGSDTLVDMPDPIQLPSEPKVRPEYGLPTDLARFSIKSFSSFDAGDPLKGTKAKGVTAGYDVADRPETIFEVQKLDLIGLPTALDTAVEGICDTISNTREDEVPLRSANVTIELGASPFVAAAIDAKDCAAGAYTILPMFELDPPLSPPAK